MENELHVFGCSGATQHDPSSSSEHCVCHACCFTACELVSPKIDVMLDGLFKLRGGLLADRRTAPLMQRRGGDNASVMSFAEEVGMPKDRRYLAEFRMGR
jgi:hypothetical protein